MSWIQDLEWANYAATRPAADASPDLELVMRDDVILTCSSLLPLPDANHACLLRTAPGRADALIDEVIDTFHGRGMPATVYLSPGCEPTDFAARLMARGFVALDELEAWMVRTDLKTVTIPVPTPGIPVRAIARDEVGTFARVFLAAFEMPDEFAPAMEALLSPSVGLDNAWHYVAYSEGRPVGTMSLLVHEHYGIIGSAGVPHSRDSRGAATNMMSAAAHEARDHGCDTLMLQTTAGTLLERLLRIKGFHREFTRTCYILEPA